MQDQVSTCLNAGHFDEPVAGLSEHLYNDLLHHSRMAVTSRAAVLGQHEFLAQLESYIVSSHANNESANCPLLVHGITGSGKTSLAAVLATNVFSLEKWQVRGHFQQPKLFLQSYNVGIHETSRYDLL